MRDTSPSWNDLHEIANGQSGHFTAQQAAEAGFSAQLLHSHVQSAKLERPMRGVYRIARFPPSDHEDLVVLWLWSGQRAVFSHETALSLLDLSDALPARIHLTLPTSTSRRKRLPDDVVVHRADLQKSEYQWLGPVPVTKPARSVLDVAAAHGDATLVAQAIDQGIRSSLFAFDNVALAGRYVADAQGWWASVGPVGVDGRRDGRGPSAPFYSRPISGTCAKAPPADWPILAVELGRSVGARLRVARYLPSRTMFLEFAWPIDGVPNEQDVKALRKRLSAKFSWE